VRTPVEPGESAKRKATILLRDWMLELAWTICEATERQGPGQFPATAFYQAPTP